MIKWFLFFVVSGILVFGVTLSFKLGAFKPVENLGLTSQSFFFLRTEHMGPYHHINDAIQRVEIWASRNQIPCTRTFGEYLDDPNSMDEDRLRSLAGCLVDRKYPVPLPADFQWDERAVRQYLQFRFSGSPAISPIKVYPKIQEASEKLRCRPGGAAIEVYEMSGGTFFTTYYFPCET